MRLAYNTNGLAHHDLLAAIELLANIGYQGIAITLDHGALNPFDSHLEDQLLQVSEALRHVDWNASSKRVPAICSTLA